MQAGELGGIADELYLFTKPFRHCPETDLQSFHDILLLGGNETFLTTFLTTFLAELFGE